MKTFLAAVLLLALLPLLGGCWLDDAYAKKAGKPSTAEKVAAVVRAVPVYGDGIADAIIGIGTLFGLGGVGVAVHHGRKRRKVEVAHAAVKADNAHLAAKNMDLERKVGNA